MGIGIRSSIRAAAVPQPGRSRARVRFRAGSGRGTGACASFARLRGLLTRWLAQQNIAFIRTAVHDGGVDTHMDDIHGG